MWLLEPGELLQEFAAQGFVQLVAHILEPPGARLDLVAADQVDAEGRGNGLAHLADLQGKGRAGERLVHHAAARDQPQLSTVLGAGTV